MIFRHVLLCLLVCFYYNLCYITVNANPTDFMSHGRMLDNPRFSHGPLESYQHSLSEFSEDITEKHKPRKKKKKKKNKRKNTQNVNGTKIKNKKSKKGRTVKITNRDVMSKKGAMDIIVHIKMNE